jgi:hypothetical protein
MRQERGLELLIQNQRQLITVKHLSGLLLEDLKNCHCLVFGKTKDEVPVLLAGLNIIPDSLYYEMFDQRIEFAVAGEILSNQYVPLTYKVEGEQFGFYGRCSTVPKVCGVDLYLSQSYTEKVGDIARQNFKISVKKLVKQCKF